MSEKINHNPICSLCEIKNAISTCFEEELNGALFAVYKFAQDENDRDLKKVRKKSKKNFPTFS